jgi:hypothetical protein
MNIQRIKQVRYGKEKYGKQATYILCEDLQSRDLTFKKKPYMNMSDPVLLSVRQYF